MKHRMLFFCLFLHFSSTLLCSFKRGKIPLVVDITSSEVGGEEVKFVIKDEDKADQRNASRGYVTTMQRIIALRMKENFDVGAFKAICCTVQVYKLLYFRILAGNQLLHDGDHDQDSNPFNRELLSHLREIAKQHKFRLELIPSQFSFGLIICKPVGPLPIDE